MPPRTRVFQRPVLTLRALLDNKHTSPLTGSNIRKISEQIVHGVLGWGYQNESDMFSIGCVVAEMVLNQPLFSACADGESYRREKTLMYMAVFGPFPPKFFEKVSKVYPEIGDGGGWFISDPVASSDVNLFLSNVQPLSSIITDVPTKFLLDSIFEMEAESRTALIDLKMTPVAFCLKPS
ncbi:hypothetical protein CPB83DRAFT_898193 [Crepidotus variabilis]|uniref:Protein kinase domain-containing protein n=1 Tax=Crepidotus variabilis TaxID=179855 RepID=A0A9P6E7F6_9AGAR|nr:hypothetical protein CPB83DRAFT_898193 [Crepidotus variabilis]